MGMWRAVLGSVALVAAQASAAPHIDIHGLVQGAEGARFVKGVPTLELPLKYGAVQVRPLGFDHNDTVFAVAVFNAGAEPANIALEDMHATLNDQPIRIWTGQDLARQAKNRAMWAQLGIAFLTVAGSAAAASQRDYYHSTFSTPHGVYSFSSSYPSVSGQLLANSIAANGALSMAFVQQRLDMALANIDENVVQRTTVDPGMAYGAIVVVDKVDYGKAPLELRLAIDWNGERYPFAFLLTKSGQPAPAEYASMLAENTRPMALDHRWSSPPGPPSAAASFAATSAGAEPPPQGAIYLSSGVIKIPAKTKSGYCLRTPYNYYATGDLNYPVVTGAMPRCEDVKEPKKGLWQPLRQ
jgi:hypothetical protein